MATGTGQQVLWREHYDPYGQKLNGVNDKIGYTGHAFDAESGLTYAQARFYDAAVGRFLSVDPFGFTGDPFSFNRYAYVNNNPYAYTDPSGMLTEDAQPLKQEVMLGSRIPGDGGSSPTKITAGPGYGQSYGRASASSATGASSGGSSGPPEAGGSSGGNTGGSGSGSSAAKGARVVAGGAMVIAGGAAAASGFVEGSIALSGCGAGPAGCAAGLAYLGATALGVMAAKDGAIQIGNALTNGNAPSTLGAAGQVLNGDSGREAGERLSTILTIVGGAKATAEFVETLSIINGLDASASVENLTLEQQKNTDLYT